MEKESKKSWEFIPGQYGLTVYRVFHEQKSPEGSKVKQQLLNRLFGHWW